MSATPRFQRSDGHPPDLQWATAERLPALALLAQAERVARHPVIEAVLDAVTGYVMLLDCRRQILAVSDALVTALGRQSSVELVGLRPGEALGCEHAVEEASGCGASKSCKRCGVALSPLATQDAVAPVHGHCRLSTSRHNELGSIEFAVRVRKVTLDDEDFLVCVLIDISAARRREMLERLFLHDSRNVLMGLLGWGEWLSQVQPSEAAAQIVSLTRRLAREIDEQQWLCQAELGTLQIQNERIQISSLLDTVTAVFVANECAKGRSIDVDHSYGSHSIVTDERLMVRVLVNMVQNAIEATPVGEHVTIRVEASSQGYRFIVGNPGEVPPEVARKLFRAKCSTKGEFRGLGTHALRIFGESCLGGKVSFETDPDAGTRFCFELPQGQNERER